MTIEEVFKQAKENAEEIRKQQEKIKEEHKELRKEIELLKSAVISKFIEQKL